MRKISFKELNDKVSLVDYIDRTSYPFRFYVDGVEYEVGLGDLDVYCEDADLIMKIEEYVQSVCNSDFNCFYDLQYLCRIEETETIVIDIHEPDDMEYEQIGEMLRKKCNIKPNSEIFMSALKVEVPFSDISVWDLSDEIQKEIDEIELEGDDIL